MKNHSMAIMALLLAAALLLCACAKQNAPVANTAPAQAEATEEPAVGLPNPLVTVESYEELLSAVPAVKLSDAPEGAQKVVYTYINMEPVISQIDFVYGGNEYTYRAAAAKADAQIDISGVYDELPKTMELESAITDGGEYTLRCDDKTTEGLATWYYEPTGCQYSLFTMTGCDVTQQIEEVVDALMVVPGAEAEEEALLPAGADGEVKGKVVSIQENNLVLNLESGSTLVFLLSNIYNAEAQPGDTVQLSYSGSLAEAPEAVSITVLESAPAEKTINGTISQYDNSYMHVVTETGNVYGFMLSGDTKYSGASKTLKEGNIVTVSYSGDIDNMPSADKINTVVVAKDAPDPLKNKKLKGTVGSLATKSLTLISDSGHKYTFPKDGSTKISGDYNLKVGATVQVTYDGYASKAPYAKEIKVLAPPDPTPPSPTPTYVPSQYHTVQGVVLVRSGNALSIQDAYGDIYAFLLASPVIIGDGYPGALASVTYYVDSHGANVVTRVVYNSVSPTTRPTPVITTVPQPTTRPVVTNTVYGVVIMQAGNALSVQDESGAIYSFLLGAPDIQGSGGVGDYVTVTYQDDGNRTNVIRLVYHMPLLTTESGPVLLTNSELAQ